MTGEDSLGAYRDAINRFTEGLLRPYIEGLPDATEPRYLIKEFNDPIWGTIVLQAQEVKQEPLPEGGCWHGSLWPTDGPLIVQRCSGVGRTDG
jgi:hypothetical protein